MLSVEAARARILAAIAPIGAERIALTEGLGRILAETIVAPFDLPRRNNTAMDGFAVRAEDVATATADAPVSLRVVETLAAGYIARERVEPGTAIRIMTRRSDARRRRFGRHRRDDGVCG